MSDPGRHDVSSYDELPDAVLVVASDGRLILVNAVAGRLLGVAAGEHIDAAVGLVDDAGRSWWECLHAADGLASRTAVPERLLTATRGARAGRQLAVTARFVRTPDRALQHVVVAVRGTEARERAERAQADLVSTVAHELRSPLTSVKGFTATLLAKWDRFTDEQKRHMLSTVNADADRVTRLISELLDVSRIESGRLELHVQVVDLWALAERVVAGQVAAGQPAERFRLTGGPLAGELWADPDKLVQVLGNLVENAVRHGAGTVSLTIGPVEGGGALLTVADQGDGVPTDLENRLFHRFVRGERRGSTGLGLFISRGIIEAHGGTIDVGHGPDGGAEFRFSLPAGTPSFA